MNTFLAANKEFWVSIAALVVIVGAALIFPPAGIALGAVYGTLELSTAVTGRDWVSGREVGTGERWFRGLLAPLDLIPAVGSVKKFAVLGRAGKLKQAAAISLKTAPAMRLKDTVKGSIHTARLEGMKRMNQLKDFAKGRAVAVGKKLEKDIIDAAKGIDKGVTAFNRFRESAFPNPQLATPDGAIVSGSKVENTHAAENFFRAKIEDVKGIGKGSKGGGNGNRLKIEDFTKEILETKPMNSPIPEKWYKKGGSISIEYNGTWTYTNKSGVSVRYPDGYPDFTSFMHPNVKPVKIEVHSPKNNPKDFKNANIEAKLSKDTDPPIFDIRRPPLGYTWHHHQDGETMLLIVKDIHDEFKHIGGQSKINGKNSK